MTAATKFDIDAFKKAFEEGDVNTALTFYSDALEHVEIDAGAPPKAPRTTGVDYIRSALLGAREGGVRLHLDNAIVSGDHAACTITCDLPDGRRLVSNTIYDLKDGKIVRQLDVLVMDPEAG